MSDEVSERIQVQVNQLTLSAHNLQNKVLALYNIERYDILFLQLECGLPE